MANQWGRDSQLTVRSRERGLLIPVIVSMVFGAAVSYGAVDYFQSNKVPVEQLTDAKTKISDLEQKVFALRGALDKANTSPKTDPALANQLSDLKRQNQSLQDEIESGKSKLQTLASENVRLKTDIKSLSDAANKGNNVAAERTVQLEQANKQLASDLLALQDSSSSTIKSLNAKIQSLQTENSAKEQAAQKKMADKLGQLEQAKADTEKALQKQIADLKQQVAAEQAASQTLQARLDDALKITSNPSNEDLQLMQNKINQLQLDLEKARAETEEVRKQLVEANAKLDAAQKPARVEPSPPEAQTPPPAKEVRDAGQVDAFIGTATGSGNLTSAQKAELKALLVNGECVADSLKSALGRVPVLMLRDLIRDLNSDC